jgi:hypothetical protein
MKRKMSGELEYLQQQQDELPYTCSDMVSTKYEFYIDQDILEPSYYRNLITVLNNATENDLVILNINSQGGSLDPAISKEPTKSLTVYAKNTKLKPERPRKTANSPC